MKQKGSVEKVVDTDMGQISLFSIYSGISLQFSSNVTGMSLSSAEDNPNRFSQKNNFWSRMDLRNTKSALDEVIGVRTRGYTSKTHRKNLCWLLFGKKPGTSVRRCTPTRGHGEIRSSLDQASKSAHLRFTPDKCSELLQTWQASALGP